MADQPKVARRSLFAGLGLALAAGIAAKLAPKVSVPDLAEPAPAEPEGDGYRLTEHVRKYYRTTNI